VAIGFDTSLDGIDWERAKADLAADHLDNGRWSLVAGTWLDNDAN
jgi:hypothetical protein